MSTGTIGRWNKTERWGDIVRCSMILGTVDDTDGSKRAMHKVAKQLKKRIEAGKVRKLGRGLYQLVNKPER
jgi:hypothetical protein